MENTNIDNANIIQYKCKICNYETDIKSNYTRHFNSNKHKEKTKFKCEDCGKFYSHRSTLSHHRKECPIYLYNSLSKLELKVNDKFNDINNNFAVINEKINAMDEKFDAVNKEVVTVVTTVIESNDKFQHQILESNNQLQTNITQTNIKLIESNNEFVKTITDNNNSVLENVVNLCQEKMIPARSSESRFNLNHYLNITCKDAPNIEDFVSGIEPTYDDVVCVGKYGYVEGNAEVIMKYLKELDQTQRPIQCSDPKRYSVYLKSGGKWEKDDDELQKTSNAVNRVCNKTYRNKKLWVEKHPNCIDSDTNSGVEYILLVKATSGGGADIDMQNNNISKKIAKSCTVKKN